MSRKPDFRIGALNKETDEKGRLGAAWSNPDGTISLVFDPFVTVPIGKEFVITLFPTKDEEKRVAAKRTPADEIPF